MQQLSEPDPSVPTEAFQVPAPAPQRIRFVRTSADILYVEIPGKPGRFASLFAFDRGAKYMLNSEYSLKELEQGGPVTIEWDSAHP